MMNHLQNTVPDARQNDRNILTKHPKELTHVEKKMLKNEKLSAIWLQISKHALNQEYQQAYEMALN
jgi:vacuolar-type H+-ATPase subunit H